MADVTTTQKPIGPRNSRADQIRKLKDRIAEAEHQGRPADLARQLLEILERR